MARDILDLDNVELADTDYPYGRVKDISAAGAGDGTPVNEAMTGDVLQFFNKLMAEGGVTANGLPDNNYSGFQFFEALEGLIPEIKYRGVVEYSDGNNLPLTVISGTNNVASFTKANIQINITSNAFADNIVSFGSDMPIGTRIKILTNNGVNPVNYLINSTTLGGFPPLRKNNVTANNTGFSTAPYQTFTATRMNDCWAIEDDT